MESNSSTSSLRTPLTQSSENITDPTPIFESKEAFLEEVRKQLWLAGPLISVSLLQFSLQLISVMFVGHLGEVALSGASIATSFASVTGFSLLVITTTISLFVIAYTFPLYLLTSCCNWIYMNYSMYSSKCTLIRD